MTTVYALTPHADYACRHAGACCTAGWRIPLEPDCMLRIRQAAADGRLPAAASRADSDGRLTVLALADGGACTAYEPSTGDRGPGTGGQESGAGSRRPDGHGRCAVHRVLGHSALPAACRHFPRVAITDDRGTHITLSHFCPTAAAALFRDDVSLGIVREPKAFACGVAYEGLDARGALPPLLHAGMLMDLEGYAAWERHAVARLACDDDSPERVLGHLARDVVRLSAWTPDQGALAAAVERLPPAPAMDRPDDARARFRAAAARRYAAVIAAIPPELQPPALPSAWHADADSFVEPGWAEHARALRHYVAAKIFASWIAWQGRGLAAVVEAAAMALAAAYGEAARVCRTAGRTLDQEMLVDAIRRADDLVVHRASPALLARAASAAPV